MEIEEEGGSFLLHILSHHRIFILNSYQHVACMMSLFVRHVVLIDCDTVIERREVLKNKEYLISKYLSRITAQRDQGDPRRALYDAGRVFGERVRFTMIFELSEF